MRNAIRTIFAVHWQPGRDTALAFATALLMIPAYYLGTHVKIGMAGDFLVALAVNGILNVLFPAYYVLVMRRDGLAELGITQRRLWLSAILSLACSFVMWKGLQRELQNHPGIDLLPHLIFNGVILWEPFFVYAWLQLRFERAFGILPAIVLAGACFGAYHLGTYPLPAVIGLAMFGIFFGVLFRITKNLLIVWPVTWSVCSSIGTLQGGWQFGWNQVMPYALILLIQVAAIAWMAMGQRARA